MHVPIEYIQVLASVLKPFCLYPNHTKISILTNCSTKKSKGMIGFDQNIFIFLKGFGFEQNIKCVVQVP